MPLNNFNISRKLIAYQQKIHFLELAETIQNIHIVAERLKLVNFVKNLTKVVYTFL